MTMWKRERNHFNYYVTNERKQPHIYVEALGTPSASTEKVLKDHGFKFDHNKCMYAAAQTNDLRLFVAHDLDKLFNIIKGSWIYYKNGKKSLNGKYVHVIKEFERAPRGTAALFKQIEKDL